MRAFLARTAVLVLTLAAGTGCGGGEGPLEPDPSALTTVQLTPDTATLFTVEPGTTVKLRAVAKDQHGETMSGVGSATFSSGNDGVATVGADGTVTAAGVGTASITAAMTAGEITKSGTATITVRVAPPAAAVQAPGFVFAPEVVDISSGGSVSWTIGAITHDVIFVRPDSPENIQPTQGVTVSRTFPKSGEYAYHCLIHAGMNGIVRVH